MFERIGDILDMYKFGTGSTLFCLYDMRDKADVLGDQPLVDLIDVAIEANLEARGDDYDWQMHKRSGPMARNAAVNRDVQIDRTLGQIYTMVKTFAEMEGDTEHKRQAQVMLDDLFPNGVHPITTQTFERQHASVAELMSRLRGPYAPTVTLLGLDPLVDNLEDFNEKFGREINVANTDTITFDQVRASRTTAEDAFHKVLFRTYANYLEDDQTRTHLLAAVADQNQRIADYRKRRASSPEIDPNTGEVIEGITDIDVDRPTPAPSDTEPTNDDTPAVDTDDLEEPAVDE